VFAIGKGLEFTERLVKGCPGVKEGHNYAKVRFTGDSHLRGGAVPLVADSSFRIDDHVYININTCISDAGASETTIANPFGDSLPL
jgi:hypothetical protein